MCVAAGPKQVKTAVFFVFIFCLTTDPTQPDSGIFTWKPQKGISLAFSFDVANPAASHRVYPLKWNYGVVSVSGGIAFSLFAKMVINSILGICTKKAKKTKSLTLHPDISKNLFQGLQAGNGTLGERGMAQKVLITNPPGKASFHRENNIQITEGFVCLPLKSHWE